MSSFTNEGLLIDRFNEHEAAIQADQKATIPETIAYSNSNTIHQMNSVYARSADQLSQLIEAAFDTLKIGSAEGFHLEEIGRLRGVFRIPASPSNTSSQYAVLKPGAVIPAGSLFSAPNLGVQATNLSSVTGTTSSCAEATAVTGGNIVTGTTYGWSINGTNYSYTTTGGESITDVHNDLISQLDADTGKTFEYTEQVYGPGPARSFIFTADEGTTLSITPLTIRITVIEVKVYFYLELVSSGKDAVGAGEMNTLLNPVVGFTETANDDDFLLGREQETDSELKLRIQAGPLSDCTGTPDTIVNSLLTNVSGVTYAKVIENLDYDTGFPTDADGRPWLSYETLVLGGSDADVAQDIWRTRPVTATTYGNVVDQQVVDSSGETKFVSFSRPSQVDIVVEVDYALYDEEAFPDGGDAAIQAAIVSYISSLEIGKDVIAGRLFGVVYGAASGIGNVVVRIKKDTDPSFTTDTVPISASEYAYTEIADVTITDVTP